MVKSEARAGTLEYVEDLAPQNLQIIIDEYCKCGL
jgi:hypothetical protein